MNREEAKFEVSKKIGEIDDSFLLEANQHKMREIPKRKKFLLPFVACLTLLCGAYASTKEIRIYNVGNGSSYITWKAENGSWGSKVRRTSVDVKPVLEKRGDEIFYIFNGSDVNLTDLCEENEYISNFYIDKDGTGFILAVGGDTNQSGYSYYFYEKGKYIFGRYCLYNYHPIEGHTTSITGGQPFSFDEFEFAAEHDFYSLDGKNLTPWHTHADSQFTKDIPEEYWGNYPETVSFPSGDGEKVDETTYQFEAMDSSSIGMSKEGEN